MYHVCEMCVWSKHAPKSVQFFWNRCRSSTLMSKAVIKLCVYAGTLERCRFVFLVFLVEQGGGLFFFFLSFFSAISLMGVLASRLAWLNCHRILAGAILLERGRVVFGVRFSSAILVWVAFEAWVFHWWQGRLTKRFRDEVSSADVGSASNMLRICKFMFSDETVMLDVLHRCFPFRCFAARFVCSSINLVDPASSHMLVSKIKPCMSQYQLLHGNTANGSLKQL